MAKHTVQLCSVVIVIFAVAIPTLAGEISKPPILEGLIGKTTTERALKEYVDDKSLEGEIIWALLELMSWIQEIVATMSEDKNNESPDLPEPLGGRVAYRCLTRILGLLKILMGL
ncbi:uncharacterized protein LOC123683224 [Harmonia axyridis]|uniref:uncharacterized protein LOC123683224 n=1 Tax=Harmonia axyridis TaxID=115357 RepID=UPI001E27960C|nr:uncharacterized protein LOC123683224 [Harmonia axyridis]